MKMTVGAGLRDAASARMPATVDVLPPPPGAPIFDLVSTQKAEGTSAISFRFAQAVGSVHVAMLDAISFWKEGFT